MEIFELKYFLAVAQVENVNKAAEIAHVSPGSLSKAITRLEQELQTPLFFRSGRNIRLTPEGTLLKQKAAAIIQLEEDTRFHLAGKETGQINIYISANEILQTTFGLDLIKKINKVYPKSKVQLFIRDDFKAIEQVQDGEAHLAMITSEVPQDLYSKAIAEVEFKTVISKAHPLLKKFSAAQTIPVQEILQHGFVIPETGLLGKTYKSSSNDGWRDDKFPRLIKYKMGGLKMIETVIKEGLAIGYLPDYFVEDAGLIALKISGCPYVCKQTIKLVCKDTKSLTWLSQLWSAI